MGRVMIMSMIKYQSKALVICLKNAFFGAFSILGNKAICYIKNQNSSMYNSNRMFVCLSVPSDFENS